MGTGRGPRRGPIECLPGSDSALHRLRASQRLSALDKVDARQLVSVYWQNPDEIVLFKLKFSGVNEGEKAMSQSSSILEQQQAIREEYRVQAQFWGEFDI